jgi:hypothetical protein
MAFAVKFARVVPPGAAASPRAAAEDAPQVRVLVVGDSGVGKTSLMNFLCGEVACSASATVGCTTHVKVCCQQCERWRSVPVSQVDLVFVCLCLFTGVHMRARVGQLLERGPQPRGVGERGARRRLAASRILCCCRCMCTTRGSGPGNMSSNFGMWVAGPRTNSAALRFTGA